MLEIENFSVTTGGKHVLNGLSLKLRAGVVEAQKLLALSLEGSVG